MMPTTPASESMEAYWRELVTTAMLGTDRRDPPEPEGPLAELVADTQRTAPSERMSALVAAATAVRRAGVLPGPSVPGLQGPGVDDRPICVPAAVDRWRHVVTSWPVLEDEWMLTVIANGWRVDPELVPAILRRHRSDPVRRTRAEVACGTIAAWLTELDADLAPRTGRRVTSAESLAELPELPIPSGLAEMLPSPGSESGPALAAMIGSGELGPPHRAVVVNLIARLRADALAEVATALAAVGPGAAGFGLASVLSDLADTRRRMLDELRRN
jgi:hypothetical protein